jgi:hypothetical protein
MTKHPTARRGQDVDAEWEQDGVEEEEEDGVAVRAGQRGRSAIVWLGSLLLGVNKGTGDN